MCICNPEIKAPFCGKPGCEYPAQSRRVQGALRVYGVSRDAGNPKSLSLALSREPSDDEIRAIHDLLRPLGRQVA